MFARAFCLAPLLGGVGGGCAATSGNLFWQPIWKTNPKMNAPANSALVLLAFYCCVVFAASLLGGWLPTWIRLTHARLQIAVSFVGGLMLGLALLGMLPHALHQIGSVHATVAWLLAGFLTMFLLQRFLPFHHHDVTEGNPLEPCGHTHSLAERSARSLSWAGVAVGLSLHSIFDGLAIAAAVAAGQQAQSGALGLGAALAVILHKPFGALAISTLMVASHKTRNFQRWVILAFALVTPLGALLFYLGAGHLADSHPVWVGAALAFCAGTFLCIACADLLPELQFHSHDRIKLSLALLAGIGIAILIARFGHVDHDHEHHRDEMAVPLLESRGSRRHETYSAAGRQRPGLFTLAATVQKPSCGYDSFASSPHLHQQSLRLWTC
jgi:zinc and cadmium transporter